jgi:hypothetical protein
MTMTVPPGSMPAETLHLLIIVCSPTNSSQFLPVFSQSFIELNGLVRHTVGLAEDRK